MPYKYNEYMMNIAKRKYRSLIQAQPHVAYASLHVADITKSHLSQRKYSKSTRKLKNFLR